MTVDDHVANFLRDAQFRIAEISVEINGLEDKGSYQYTKLNESRLQLSLFMSMLYEGKWLITGSYNHVQIGEGQTWTEYELISEIQYLRHYNKMNVVPYITFTPHYPKIAGLINGGGSGSVSSLPAGNFGQLMGFNGNGDPEAQDIDEWAGHRTGETITAYFSGRP